MTIPELVSSYDPQNQFDVIKNSYQQIQYVKENSYSLDGIDTDKVSNIIVTGLGGSAIGGEFLSNLLKDDLNIPYTVNRNYDLPKYANENTLVIASSYSGNTEETLAAVSKARELGCQIICVTTGGKLQKFAEENNLPVCNLKEGYQPRFAIWVNFFTLFKVLQLLNFVADDNDLLGSSIELLRKKAEEFTKDDNTAYKIAEDLVGFIPVIYSADDYTSAVGGRLKGQFNENSKVHAFHNVYPELNHNEIIGWETFRESQFNAKLINIVDASYNPRINKRIEVTTEVVANEGVDVINLQSAEKEFKLRLIDLVYLGDWISYYLTLLREQDPSEIKNIHYLKEQLAHTET